MPHELIPGSERPLRRVERRESLPVAPWLGALPTLSWTYTRAEVYVEGDEARISAERKTFEDGRLVTERFEGSGDPAELWWAAERMQQQMLEAMNLWLRSFSLFLPPPRDTK